MKGSSIKLFELYKKVESTPKEFKPPAGLGLKYAFEKRKVEKGLTIMKKIIRQSLSENEGIFSEGIQKLKELKNHPNYYIKHRAAGILSEFNETENKIISKLEKIEDKTMSYRSNHALGGVGEIQKILKENNGSRRIKIAGLESLRRIALKHSNNEIHNASLASIKDFLKKEKGLKNGFSNQQH